MSEFNPLGGLHREIHHVKVLVDGTEKYEPAMVILMHERKGRSFIIPLGAMWKYADPFNRNQDETIALLDRQDFEEIVKRAAWRRSLAACHAEIVRATMDTSCCVVAEVLSRGMGMLLCTAWNLAKIMQMFDIEPSPHAATGLLHFIQDRLDDLKNFPEHDQDDRVGGTMGDIRVMESGKTILEGEIPMTEADLFVPDEVTRH